MFQCVSRIVAKLTGHLQSFIQPLAILNAVSMSNCSSLRFAYLTEGVANMMPRLKVKGLFNVCDIPMLHNYKFVNSKECLTRSLANQK